MNKYSVNYVLVYLLNYFFNYYIVIFLIKFCFIFLKYKVYFLCLDLSENEFLNNILNVCYRENNDWE